jgi:hypothetical protein
LFFSFLTEAFLASCLIASADSTVNMPEVGEDKEVKVNTKNDQSVGRMKLHYACAGVKLFTCLIKQHNIKTCRTANLYLNGFLTPATDGGEQPAARSDGFAPSINAQKAG